MQNMPVDQSQQAYRMAVESWIAAIRKEEVLASGSESIAQVDQWEQAQREEEQAREAARLAKQRYEAALREKFFGFR